MSFLSSFNWTEIYHMALLVGVLLGAIALIVETHLHGWTQFVVFGGVAFVLVVMISVVMTGQPPAHWVMVITKVLMTIGIGVGLREYLHWEHHHHHMLRGTLVGILVLGLMGLTLAWDPQSGFGSPSSVTPTLPSLPPARTANPGFPSGPGFSRPSTSATTTAVTPPAPTNAASAQVGFGQLDCSKMSFRQRERVDRCKTP